MLADTAMVGHLGTRRLAALAVAGTLLSGSFTLFNFLTYGTTAQVARLAGAGRREEAGRLAAQSLWLAVGFGVALMVAIAVLAGPLVALVGAEGRTADLATGYLRLSALGLPFALIALSGQGYLRGIGDLRTPLVILVIANAVNVVLGLVLIYGLGFGFIGSALGTVIAQAGMGAAFVWALLRAPASGRRPSLAAMAPLTRIGREIFVRTAALYGSFLVAGGVLARVGDASLAAHQVAFQLFVFLALLLDALAIAGQVLTGRELGAGRAEAARAAARRLIELSVGVGVVFAVILLALHGVIPRGFTSDAGVLDRAAALWPLFALLQITGAPVFALDGILIGAGDTRYLMWGMLTAFAVFAPLALLSLHQGYGVVGVWAALNVLMAVRLVVCAVRFRSGRWAVTGVA